MILGYMTALQPDTHRLSSCDLRSQRLSLVEWKQETLGLKQTAFSTPRNLRWQNEADDMFGLNVSLIGQRVPISVSSAGRLEEWKKKTSYREIGNWVRRGITCYSRSKLPLGLPQRRAPHYQPRLISLGVWFIKWKNDLISVQCEEKWSGREENNPESHSEQAFSPMVKFFVEVCWGVYRYRTGSPFPCCTPSSNLCGAERL